MGVAWCGGVVAVPFEALIVAADGRVSLGTPGEHFDILGRHFGGLGRPEGPRGHPLDSLWLGLGCPWDPLGELFWNYFYDCL